MKKIFKFLLTIAVFAIFSLSAMAGLVTEGNISSKVNSLRNIANYDYSTFVNKTELIGYMKNGFEMSTYQYKNDANSALESVQSTQSQINMLRNSSDYSDTDKEMQINNLLKQVDSTLYDLDSKTMDYLYKLRNLMPTLTYRKYVKKFTEFYNSQQLTYNQMYIK